VLELFWRETGGPPVAEPSHRGFGVRLISGALEQFSGMTEMTFEASGLICRATAKLSGSAITLSQGPEGNGKVRSCPNKLGRTPRSRAHEVERLIRVAKGNRHGHRDATMVLIGFRHGLRVSELCDLQWSSIEFETATMHVRRAKGGQEATHSPLG
jgi:integrase